MILIDEDRHEVGGGSEADAPHVVVVAPPATYVSRWCEYFRGVGWRVDWISYGFRGDGAIAHIEEIAGRTPVEAWNAMRQSRRLRRLLSELKPDLVHAQWFTGPAWLMALVPGRPYIATAWGSDVLRFAGMTRFRRFMARRVGASAAAITYDAEPLADALVALGLPRSVMRRLVFGADADAFKPGAPDAALVRGLGVTNDDPIVLFMRGVDPVYEPETVIRAFAKATRTRPCNLLIRVDHVHSAGTNEVTSATDAWAALRRVVGELGVADRVFPYTSIERAGLPRLLSSGSVFLSVSNSDGTSVALLEALFCETPVIVSDLPANREWILDESFGHIVPVGDADALATAILDTLTRPTAAREAAVRAGVHARRHGDAATEFARARDLSLDVINERSGRAG